jgi:integrase
VKDGTRETNIGVVQRYLCKNRECNLKFSEKSYKDCLLTDNSQLCAKRNAKKLVNSQEIKTCAVTGNQTQDGLIVDFQWKMKKRNKSKSTIMNRTILLSKLVKLGADLTTPESVETVLATEEFTPANKYNTVKAYRAFTKTFKIDWEPIDVNYQPKEAFVPLEEEIDLLINASSKVTATFLQVAKDTGARCGEIRKIQWTDINEKDRTIAINQPEKGSKTRTVKVTEKTIAMVKNLKKIHGDYIFNPTFVSQRKTQITNNQRLLKIHFHSLRHWRASKEYERTGDIYSAKYIMGHKALSSTDRYQHGTYSSEEYITKRPKTSQEEDTLINAGFEFVRFDNKEDVPVYRKRK